MLGSESNGERITRQNAYHRVGYDTSLAGCVVAMVERPISRNMSRFFLFIKIKCGTRAVLEEDLKKRTCSDKP